MFHLSDRDRFMFTSGFYAPRAWQHRILALMLSLLLALIAAPAWADRIKDLGSFRGVRANQLIGYGLVVGLDGSGDQVRQTPFTQQSLTNMLSQLGVTVPQGTNMQVKNVARWEERRVGGECGWGGCGGGWEGGGRERGGGQW